MARLENWLPAASETELTETFLIPLLTRVKLNDIVEPEGAGWGEYEPPLEERLHANGFSTVTVVGVPSKAAAGAEEFL